MIVYPAKQNSTPNTPANPTTVPGLPHRSLVSHPGRTATVPFLAALSRFWI